MENEADNKETARPDIDGNDIITDALMEILNSYPGLDEGEEIAFATLPEDTGIAMFPVSGAVIKSEKRSVTGDVHQECLYPMYIFYRACAPSQKERARIKEWLDTLGKWLERQPVAIDGTIYRLEGYPELAGDNRYFENIYRTGPGHLQTVTADRTEDWAIAVTAQYNNEF